jgi:hypothetical protein
MEVHLVTNPAGDRQFRVAAEAHLAAGARTPEALAARLRERYPNVSVVTGITDAASERWYVYREGRWLAVESEPAADEAEARRR